MNRSSAGRRALWLLALLLVAVGTPAAGLLYSYSSRGALPTHGSASRKDATSSGKHGVVCFGQVDLEHGVTALYPLQPGRVVEVPVQEGQTVSEGTVLVRLEDGPARSRVAEAQAALDAAQLRLEQARKMPEQHRGRIAQQEDAVEAMRRRRDAAQHQLDRQKELAKKQLVDSKDLPVSEDKVREVQAMLRGEEKRLDELKKQDPLDDARRAEKDVAMMRARLEQARLALEDCILKAPRRGTVLRVLVGPGDVLSSQTKQPAVQFAIDGPQVVRADVEQEFIDRVDVGQTAIVEDESRSGAIRRGEVKRVSNWVTQRRSVLREPFEFNDVRTIEALIALEPGQPPLRIGQRVRVRLGSADNSE
jgi:multidrug resistance efflux pump